MPDARSYLYVPGHRSDRLAKALDRAGDAVLADLEDAVPAAAKAQARHAVSAWLSENTGRAQRPSRAGAMPQLWVRVNAGELMAPDLAAVVSPGLAGVVLPKCEPASLEQADAVLQAAERAAGLAAGTIELSALVETAGAVLELATIAAHPRVCRVGLGEADLAADLGLVAPDFTVLAPLRLQVVVVSAAAGIGPPVGPVHTELGDQDTLAVTSRALRAGGFGSRSAIHPEQVAVIEAAFTPAPAEITAARELVASFEQSGGGAARGARGMVDEAVVRAARRVVELAERLGL